MYRVRGRLWVKLLGILLLVASTLAAGRCGVTVLAQLRGYGTAPLYSQDRLCLDLAEEYARWEYLVRVQNGDRETPAPVRFQGGYCRIYEEGTDGEQLLYGAVPPNTADLAVSCYFEDGSMTVVPAASEKRETLTESGIVADGVPGKYRADVWVSTLLAQQGSGGAFYRNERLYGFLQNGPYPVQLWLVLTGGMSLGLLLFLLSAAGRRRGVEGVVLNWQDRVPLDLYAGAVGGGLAVLAGLAREACRSALPGYGLSFRMLVFLLLCCLVAAGLMLLALLMTVAARVKKGSWWRNTVLYRIFHTLYRCIQWTASAVKEFTNTLPTTWKLVGLAAAVLAAQSILTIFAAITWYARWPAAVLLLLDGCLLLLASNLARQLHTVRQGARRLAEGHMDAKVDTHGLCGFIRSHGEDLNAIGRGMHLAVEEKLRSERLKTELITNVSHDIKTPLTSIVNYVDLLQKEELPDTAASYLAILDRQSKRLKKLTEDLVEASKASTGNVAVRMQPLVVNEIIHQAIGDYDERLTAGKLEVVVSAYRGNVMAMADGRLLWRVLDNLFSNVCKYALSGTRVYVDVLDRGETVLIVMKNVSRDPLNGAAEELLERFVRGDLSRHTEGSGLGLNIAGSLMELMGGGIALSSDGDLFKAELTLQKAPDAPEEA